MRETGWRSLQSKQNLTPKEHARYPSAARHNEAQQESLQNLTNSAQSFLKGRIYTSYFQAEIYIPNLFIFNFLIIFILTFTLPYHTRFAASFALHYTPFQTLISL